MDILVEAKDDCRGARVREGKESFDFNKNSTGREERAARKDM